MWDDNGLVGGGEEDESPPKSDMLGLGLRCCEPNEARKDRRVGVWCGLDGAASLLCVTVVVEGLRDRADAVAVSAWA